MTEKIFYDIILVEVGCVDDFTPKKAYELLLRDVIHDSSDLEKKENRWIWHSLYVGEAALRIAEKLKLDGNYAMVLGYVHDIGRKISHEGHPIYGYQYMKRFDLSSYGRSCLTHSFINNDIHLTAGVGPSGNTYLFLDYYLQVTQVSDYDNIIQLCDLFCTANGFTTIEKRLLDITRRKGVTEYSKAHYDSVMELKARIEKRMGIPLYQLFPEIEKEDLSSISQDQEALLELIEQPQVKK